MPTTCIKHFAVSGLSNSTARIKSSCNLIGKCSEIGNKNIPPTVRHKRRKTNDSGILLQKDKKMETANAQNSTFANRTSQRTTKICKRAVFFHRTEEKSNSTTWIG
ncbi:MAG: hypothetical protein GYA62_17695 [Bacteroidales bacterium]|nr:hypothetical protein [Bacteroidales bacterium]